jgi:esterase/lipase
MNCNIFPSQEKRENIIILHGISAIKSTYDYLGKRLQKKGYTTIICNSDRFNWDNAVKEYDNLISSLGKETILIGHSMGGAQSLVIASKNPLVKKVFAFSPPYDVYFDGIPKEYSEKIKEVQPIVKNALPKKNLSCQLENSNKYYIGYNPKDKIVHESHVNQVIHDVFHCIPPENVKKNIKKFENVSHFKFLEYERVLQFIENNLE